MSVSRPLRASWLRIIGLLVTLVALSSMSGCSAVKLAYNNLTDVGYWWLDGYVDFNEPQTLRLRADLALLHQWHRETELVKLADLLKKVQQMAPSDTTAQQVCGLYTELRERFDALALKAEPVATALAMKLDPAQLSHLQTRFDKGNADWRRDWASGSPSARQNKRLKAMLERAEQFYGTLDERQQAVLVEAIARSRFDPQRSYTERVRRQQDLLQTLRVLNPANGGERPTAAAASAALRAVLDRSWRSPDPDFRAYADSAIQDNCSTYARLHNSTSTEQRARARSRLAEYERDARELAARS